MHAALAYEQGRMEGCTKRGETRQIAPCTRGAMQVSTHHWGVAVHQEVVAPVVVPAVHSSLIKQPPLLSCQLRLPGRQLVLVPGARRGVIGRLSSRVFNQGTELKSGGRLVCDARAGRPYAQTDTRPWHMYRSTLPSPGLPQLEREHTRQGHDVRPPDVLVDAVGDAAVHLRARGARLPLVPAHMLSLLQAGELGGYSARSCMGPPFVDAQLLTGSVQLDPGPGLHCADCDLSQSEALVQQCCTPLGAGVPSA